ncbi:hypothetical protein AB1Y20_022201 [Prymnesium parvum]|uniref:Thioredoxin domain-containing protein n=1 Tax=Prymnesium parvum TaxID=97485 RepID=A0AB34JIN4_PRYPA
MARALPLLLLLAEAEARLLVPTPPRVSPGAVNPDPKAGPNDAPLCVGDACVPPPLAPRLAHFCRALSALHAESGGAFGETAGLLLKYCANVASSDDPRFRRIKKSNRAFARRLAPFASAVDCLRALGFEEQHTEAEGEVLVLASAEAAVLSAAVATLTQLLLPATLADRWPAPLRPELNRTCASLAFKHDLLDELTAELEQRHIGALLRHDENLARARTQLSMGTDGVRQLCDQLQAVRANMSAAAAHAGMPASAEGRVVAVASMEQWYDLLMDTKGLVVAYFGATWCAACKQAEPIFVGLSASERYRDVTFVQVDADATPALVGDNHVEAFPTIKFYRNAGEEYLPVVGANMEEVEQTLEAYVTSQ